MKQLNSLLEILFNLKGLWKFCSVLFFLFLFFKLANYGVVAQWDWLWVIAPMAFPVVLVFGGTVVLFMVIFPVKLAQEIVQLLRARKARKQRELIKILTQENN